MNNKINKDLVQQAKDDFESIRKFAMESASNELEESVTKKVLDILNENVTITIDTDSDEEVEIKQDGSDMTGMDMDSSDSFDVVGGEETMDVSGDEDEFMVSDDEDEIMVSDEEDEEDEEIEEIENITQDTNMENNDEMEMEKISNPFEAIMDKLSNIENIIAGSDGAQASDEVEVVDDETVVAPDATAAPAAPTQDVNAPVEQPVQEDDEMMEIEIFEDEDMLEVVDEMEDDMEFEIVNEEDDMEEGVSFSDQNKAGQRQKYNTGDRNHGPLGKHAQAAVNENKKAQEESAKDELIKENESLKKQLLAKKSEIKKFEDSFTKLRESFDEMQTFNAKLALAYKVSMLEGLTRSEKMLLADEFDNAETIKEAEVIYKKAVKETEQENRPKNNSEKIKSISTKTAVPTKSSSEPLYESAEVKRMKQLAGIKKLED